ncbi:hypothetical protein ACXNAM_21765, partial [Kluyvera cryocrescens]
VFAGKKSAQIREILISESAWEEMTCLFAPSLVHEVLWEKYYIWTRKNYSKQMDKRRLMSELNFHST